MTNPPGPIAVIGGGLTGLVAAYHLRHNPPWPPVVLFESDTRLGGKIKTSICGEALIEEGADSFLAREPMVVELCRDLGIESELVRPAVFGAQIYSGGTLYPLPQGFLRGVPSSVRSALDAEILSTRGALRTAADLMWPRKLSGGDVSFGGFLSKRFGREVVDKLVSAVMSGTRAGVPEQVSLAAAAPEIDAIARRHRSVMRGMREVRREGSLETGPPPFRSLRLGLSRLVDTLREHLGSVDIRTETTVDRIERDPDGYHVVAAAERLRVAGAIVTTPTHVGARILQGIAPDAAHELQAVRYSSSASITLVYPEGALTLPEGSGLLVPAAEGRALSACTWFSRKWPQHAPADGSDVVRGFIGRTGRSELLDASDDGLVKAAHQDLMDMIDARAHPTDVRVQRWDNALPQYAIGHLDSIERVERALAGHPISLAGAGLRGSGIPDCVKQAQSAAASVVHATVGSTR